MDEETRPLLAPVGMSTPPGVVEVDDDGQVTVGAVLGIVRNFGETTSRLERAALQYLTADGRLGDDPPMVCAVGDEIGSADTTRGVLWLARTDSQSVNQEHGGMGQGNKRAMAEELTVTMAAEPGCVDQAYNHVRRAAFAILDACEL